MPTYSASGATLRGDLNTVVEEGAMTRSLDGASGWFIAPQILPEYGVSTKTGQYPKWTIGGSGKWKDEAGIRAPGGSYPRVQREVSNDNYACVDRGLEDTVDVTTQAEWSRFFDAEAAAANFTRQQVMIGHERRVSSLIMNTGTFGSATSATAAYTAANVANNTLDFPKDILDVIKVIEDRGESANTIVMSSDVWRRIQLTTKLQDWVRGVSRVTSDVQLNMTTQLVQESFAVNGISQVLVGRTKYDASKNKTASVTSVWGNTYIWVGKVMAGDFMTGGVGRTLVWNEEGGLWVTESYYEEEIRSNVVRVRQHTDEKIINANAGQLLATSYA